MLNNQASSAAELDTTTHSPGLRRPGASLALRADDVAETAAPLVRLAPLLLDGEQQRDELVLEFFLVLELVAQRQLVDQCLRVLLDGDLQLLLQLVQRRASQTLQTCAHDEGNCS